MAQSPDSGRTRESVTDIVQGFPEFGAPKPTYLERSGTLQMSLLLGGICLITVAFLIAWAVSRPTLRDVAEVLHGGAGSGPVDPDKIVETLGKLHRDHTEQFR